MLDETKIKKSILEWRNAFSRRRAIAFEIKISENSIEYCRQNCVLILIRIDELEEKLDTMNPMVDYNKMGEMYQEILFFRDDHKYWDGKRTSEYLKIQKLRKHLQKLTEDE